LTEQALNAGDLPVPDLAIGAIAEMNQRYALAVGLNKQGLGDEWAAMLGQRVLAVTTLAGSGESGLGGNNKPAIEAQLYKPKGVARDEQGNYYIADEGNHAIRKVAVNGVITTYSGLGIPQFSGDGGPASDAGLWWPRTLVAAPGGMLYVADTLNMRIRQINLADGTIATVAGNPDQANGAFLNDFAGDGGPASQAKLAGVRGMALDSLGNLVFADTWDNDGGSWHHIRRIERNGTVGTLVGVDGVHGFNGDGKPGRETQINYVNQVALDAQDNVYFADARNHRVRRYDMRTQIVTTVAGNGQDGVGAEGVLATETTLSSPYGVAVDREGRIFIAERGSRRVRVVGTDGKIRTLAGGGTYTGDGAAGSVAFTEPHDLVLEPDGNLLMCDSRAAKVRRIWLKWGF
jgi:sugar lactone lactonase YvrE